MRVDTTSDSPSWTKVFEITDELNGLSETLEKKYPNLDLELAVCVRCVPKQLERKDICRYYAKDKILGLDIALDEEDFVSLKKDKMAQRKLIGAAFISFFAESVKKYEKKIPDFQPISMQLIADVHQWCAENEWTT